MFLVLEWATVTWLTPRSSSKLPRVLSTIACTVFRGVSLRRYSMRMNSVSLEGPAILCVVDFRLAC